MRRHFRPIVLLVFVTFRSVIDAFDADYQDLTKNAKLNTTVISDVLNKLVDPKTYDKRLRPKYGREPVDVGITIHVSSISAVSEVDMDFTLDFYLRQTWRDPRLAYDKFDIGWKSDTGDKLDSLTVGVDYLERLWKPDTFFPNEKKSFFHLATTHNSFLRIDPDGTVFTSQRLTVTATCPMVLHLFPMDSQKCKLEIESYGYSTDDISYTWFHGAKSISRSPFELPQFLMTDVQISTKLEKLSSGVYSRLVCRFLFTRSIGFYIIQIYLPSMLIVIISWVSFWLARDATPARVALGVTTVLTMTTLMTTTNAAMPKVSYVKSIDIYLGTCFLMVFASLLEYAAVGYINKRMRLRQERRKTQKEAQLKSTQLQPQATFSPRSSPGPAHRMLLPMQNKCYQPFYARLPPDRNWILQEPSPPRLVPLTSPMSGAAQFHEVECDCDLKGQSFGTTRLRQVTLKSPTRAPKRNRCRLSPSSIDKYSRIIFPLTFIAFNGVYWVVYMHVSKTALEFDGYTTADIDYYWGKSRGSDAKTAVAFSDFSLPQFAATGYIVNTTKATTSSGDYVRLHFEIILDRSMGFYLMNIFIPSILIVIISWVSFWLNREASPARVALGVTTVLTMTTLTTTTNSTMPKVSYVKAIDYFLGFCFVMVFASLLEYAAVSYLNKKLAQRREKRRKKAEEEQSKPVEYPMFSSSSKPTPVHTGITSPLLQSERSGALVPMLGRYSPVRMMHVPGSPCGLSDHHLECDCDLSQAAAQKKALWPAPFGKAKRPRRTTKLSCTPSKIDKYSRAVFPLLFLSFNYGYTTDTIKYHWCLKRTDEMCPNAVTVQDDSDGLPKFQFGYFCVNETTATLASGSYSRLWATFTFSRNSGFYVLQVCVPAVLVVCISWVSFWINRDSAPARTSLGIFTVLTETQMMTSTNRQLPPVSYVKAIDIFLGTCYVMVVLALVEYALVAYSTKKRNDQIKRWEKKKQRLAKQQRQPRPPQPDVIATTSHDFQLAACTCPVEYMAPEPPMSLDPEKPRNISRIDFTARIVFPIVFTIFNFIYWLALTNAAGRLTTQTEDEQC